jgi:hypothetical protein
MKGLFSESANKAEHRARCSTRCERESYKGSASTLVRWTIILHRHTTELAQLSFHISGSVPIRPSPDLNKSPFALSQWLSHLPTYTIDSFPTPVTLSERQTYTVSHILDRKQPCSVSVFSRRSSQRKVQISITTTLGRPQTLLLHLLQRQSR